MILYTGQVLREKLNCFRGFIKTVKVLTLACVEYNVANVRTWENFGRGKIGESWAICQNFPRRYMENAYSICTDLPNFSLPIAFTCMVHQNFPLPNISHGCFHTSNITASGHKTVTFLTHNFSHTHKVLTGAKIFGPVVSKVNIICSGVVFSWWWWWWNNT